MRDDLGTLDLTASKGLVNESRAGSRHKYLKLQPKTLLFARSLRLNDEAKNHGSV